MKRPPAKQHTVKRCDGRIIRWRERWEHERCGECGHALDTWEQVTIEPFDHLSLGPVYKTDHGKTYQDCLGCGEKIPTLSTIIRETYSTKILEDAVNEASAFSRRKA